MHVPILGTSILCFILSRGFSTVQHFQLRENLLDVETYARSA